MMEKLVLTIGTNRTVAIPLLDAQHHGPANLVIGPGNRRNSWRFYTMMPKVEHLKNLHVPPGYDIESIRFSPCTLLVVEPIPRNVQAHILRITSPEGKHTIQKKVLRNWEPDIYTQLYPCTSLHGPQLRPGQIIEVEGASWTTGRSIDRRKRFKAGFEPDVYNDCKTFVPTQMTMVIEYTFLAMAVQYNAEMVDGSPLNTRQPFTAHDGADQTMIEAISGISPNKDNQAQPQRRALPSLRPRQISQSPTPPSSDGTLGTAEQDGANTNPPEQNRVAQKSVSIWAQQWAEQRNRPKVKPAPILPAATEQDTQEEEGPPSGMWAGPRK